MTVSEAFSVFKLDFSSSKKVVDRYYKKYNTMFLCGKIDENSYGEIESAYQVLSNYYKELRKVGTQEKEIVKARILYDTLKIERDYECRSFLEKQKGKVWVFFNSVIENDFDGSLDDYLEYVKQGTLDILNDEYKDLYKEFFDLFLTLWQRVYKRICVCEKNNLLQGLFDKDCYYSFGEDELRDVFYRKNRGYALGKFSRLLDLGVILSNLVPEENASYFLDIHLSFMSSFYGFGYNVSEFNKIVIYKFVTTSRLQQLKMDFYDMFDEEVRKGMRKSPFVDNQELFLFIYEHLRIDNPVLGEDNVKERLLR